MVFDRSGTATNAFQDVDGFLASSHPDTAGYVVIAEVASAHSVGALSSVCEQLTSLRQRQLTPVLLAYLKQSQASGSTCGSNSGSLSTCLWACVGKFSIYVDYEDLRGLIEGFGSFEALDLMSASQVAQLTLNSGALNNADLIGLGFDRLDAGNAFRDVDEFLAALTWTPQSGGHQSCVREQGRAEWVGIRSLSAVQVGSPQLGGDCSGEAKSGFPFTVNDVPLPGPALLQRCSKTVKIEGGLRRDHVKRRGPEQRSRAADHRRDRAGKLAPVLLAYLSRARIGRSSGGGATWSGGE
ncbi:hypothetical protein ROHU_005994 [Labeo rohita]|uniref:Uncharacterized protein n=1 Tax=Labeo rohita TaxID=84645 RepID=A0A498N7T7_LABRO|nr:hypothetical protein ROHU_005994 [Labeo rohita]